VLYGVYDMCMRYETIVIGVVGGCGLIDADS